VTAGCVIIAFHTLRSAENQGMGYVLRTGIRMYNIRVSCEASVKLNDRCKDDGCGGAEPRHLKVEMELESGMHLQIWDGRVH